MPPLSEEEKLQMEQMRSLMDKQRAGATLTAEEKALLQQFEANRPQR